MRNGLWRILVGVGLLGLAAGPGQALDVRRVRIEKEGKVIDEAAIEVETDLLVAAVTTGRYAGQVMKLVYKPTGHDLCSMTGQGYFMDRMGEGRGFWFRQGEGFYGKVVAREADKVVLETGYVWNYPYEGEPNKIALSKTYTLREGASAIEVVWRIKNIGERTVMMSPWVKQLGGRDETLLSGPTYLLQERGLVEGGGFLPAVTDWQARVSGTENRTDLPMVASVIEFPKVFQHFPWHGKHRFTLETVLSRITLEPGQEWALHVCLNAMANLGRPVYVCPELAASVQTDGPPATGQRCALTASISPACRLGAKRLEGEVLDSQGKVVAKLPNREVTLTPGCIAEAAYEFTPPADGVYILSLTVYDEQQILRLGSFVESQQSSITLPVVVGPRPESVVKKWQSDGFRWPTREGRSLTAPRTIATGPRVKAGQFPVAERVYPEDTIRFAETAEPALAHLAKGEYEDVQLVVDFEREEDVLALDIEVGELTGPGGAVLERAELREAIYLTTEIPSGYKSFPVGQWPDPLFPLGWEKAIPDAPVTKRNLETFRKSRRRTFFLIAKAPRKGPAGEFTGTITLSLAGETVATVPVVYSVADFALPKRAHYRCSTGMVGWKGIKANLAVMGLSKESIAALEKEKPAIDRYRELILEYGWTPTMWAGRAFWEKYYDHGRGVSVFAGPREADVPWLEEKDLLQYAFVYAPFDEHTVAEVPEVVAWAKEHRAKSKIPILDCYYGDVVEPLFGLVDIWCGQSPTQPWAQERKRQGDKFFAVNSSLVWHIEYDPIGGRADMWNDFVVGYDGRYVYSTCRWTNDVYEKNWTSGNYMGCVVYPAPDGLCTSRRLETLRDGVEDYDYLAILRARLGSRGQDHASEAAQEAERLLGDPALAERVRTPESLYAMRQRIAELILRLAE